MAMTYATYRCDWRSFFNGINLKNKLKVIAVDACFLVREFAIQM